MNEGVTELSKQIYSLHMTIFWWCVAIGVAVFGVMIYALLNFRKSKGAIPDTLDHAQHQGRDYLDRDPGADPGGDGDSATRALINIEDMRNTEMTVRSPATSGAGSTSTSTRASRSSRCSTASTTRSASSTRALDPASVPDYLLTVDNPLVVPAGTKVRLLLTAQDVIHSWWVPAFGMKKDAIPGFVNEMWFKVDADKTGHLPRPVRRALRSRPRLHAGGGEGP